MGTKTSTTYTMSTTPSWYSNYAQDIVANQNAVSSRPFTPYDASQRVAGFNPTQQQGFNMTQQAATGYQPLLGSAIQTGANTLGRSSLGAAQPYLDRAASQQGMIPAYNAMGQAAQYTQASTNPMAVNFAAPYLQQASNMSAAGAAAPNMQMGTNLALQSTNPMALNFASPYLQQAASMSPADAAAPGMQQGANLAMQSTNPMALNLASPYLQQASGMSAAGAAMPGMQQGANLTMQSTAPTGLNMAQPYLQQAGQSSVSNIGSYMNPYIENVVNRFGELGARTLQEQLMPAITSKYIKAGQLGGPTRPGTGASGAPSGMMTDTARALRDVQDSVGQQQRQALSEGYTQAAGLSQADLARQGQLAQTAGNFGFQQQGVLGQAGQQLGALGQQFGALTGQDQQALTNIGQQYGSLGQAQQQAVAQAGQQIGALGQQYGALTGQQQQTLANIGQQYGALGAGQQQALAQAGQQVGALGQQYGALTGQDQQALTNIGQQFGALGAGQQQALGQAGQQMGALGAQYANIGQNQQQFMSTLAGQVANMYGQDTANQLAASGQLGQFAQQMQQQGLTGAQAVTGAGNQQQALEQARSDANYQEFLRRSGYDQAQIDQMTKTFAGVAGGVPQGQVSLQTNKGPSGSMVGNLTGAALTLAGSSGRT